tara:strand:+ start:108 stop:530 length:423 start_codon:yes stop_codon:yes gene_type:complete
MIRKNKKRIDPRFFLNETVTREGDITPAASNTMAQLSAGAICKNPSEVLAGIKGLNSYLRHFGMEEQKELSNYSRELRNLLQEKPPVWSAIEQAIRSVYSIYEKAGLVEWEEVKAKTKQLATCAEAEQYNLEEAIKREQN